MSTIEKDIRKYISDVGKNLICSGKLKKQILKDIENTVLDYTDNRQITDINEIYAHFGTPEDLAKTFLLSADVKSVKRKIKVRNIIIVLAVLALTAVAVYVVHTIIIMDRKSVNFYLSGPVIEDEPYSQEDESNFYRTEENT